MNKPTQSNFLYQMIGLYSNIFLRNHVLQLRLARKTQELEVKARSKKLLNERFMPEYQELHEGMNLVQMMHIGSFKAYVFDFNA